MAAVIILLVILMFPAAVAGTLTALAAKQLKNQDFEAAAKNAQLAQYPVETYSLLTFRLIPGLEAWRYGLNLISQSPGYLEQILLAGNGSDTIFDLRQVEAVAAGVSLDLQPLAANLNRAPFAKLILGRQLTPANLQLLQQAADSTDQVGQLLSEMTSHDQTWIVVLQNSDELRASGGFAGSYLVVPIKDGQITELITEDIYDADGQFKGYFPPPPGVKEYLSSNNGLRLPDANWHADFPTSANQMMQFFALGSRQDIEGLIVINSPLAENLMDVTGPIALSDYDAQVTSENITELLRSERGEFFPGSVQKKHLLSLLFSQMRLELTQLEPEQLSQMGGLLGKAFSSKEMMFYARNPEIQDQLERLGVAGELNQNQSADYLYLVESNVGINKANRNISRSVELEVSGQQAVVTAAFNNSNLPKTWFEYLANEAAHNGYVNYQRLITHPNWQLEEILYDGQAIEKIDTTEFTTSSGQRFVEHGFLITLREQEQKVLTVKFKRQPPLDDSPQSITIQKQPGLQPTDYTLTTPAGSQTFILEKDLTLVLQ